MKANDLMIGDWIIFHDSGYASDGTTWEENRVCQIDGIDEDVRVKWYDESGYKEDWPHVSTVLLSPIPLTPEILEKNGFIGEGYQILTLDDGHWLEYYNHEHRLTRFWEGIDEWQNHSKVRDVVFRCHCHYVHELQHALKLCCIEKEIEL